MTNYTGSFNTHWLRNEREKANASGKNRVFAGVEKTVNGAYTGGDVFGGEIKYDGAGGPNSGGTMMSISLRDTGGVLSAAETDVFVYSQPLATPIADNAAFAETDAMFKNFVGKVTVATGDWETVGTNEKTVTKSNLAFPFQGDHLYAYVVTRGTPNPSTKKLLSAVGVIHD